MHFGVMRNILLSYSMYENFIRKVHITMFKSVTAIFLSLSFLLFAPGCSKESAPEPPVSRAELTQRLFEALQTKRDADALAIVDKLLALDNDDSDLIEMRERIVGNICTRKVQSWVNQGNLDAAHQYIVRQRRLYPTMPKLRILESEVNELVTLRNAAISLAAAKDVKSLEEALSKIEPLAAKYPYALQLKRDIARRKQDLQKMRQAPAEKQSTPGKR